MRPRSLSDDRPEHLSSPADAGLPGRPAATPALNPAPTPVTRARPRPPRELEARHAELSDAYLRAKAEAENIRRRAEEEMAKARKYAVENFAERICR